MRKSVEIKEKASIRKGCEPMSAALELDSEKDSK